MQRTTIEIAMMLTMSVLMVEQLSAQNTQAQVVFQSDFAKQGIEQFSVTI